MDRDPFLSAALPLPLSLQQPLIDGLLEAVCLVEPLGLRVVAANRAAAVLFGVAASALVGRPAIELSGAPEDEAFWEEVAAGAAPAWDCQLHSDSQVRRADGRLLPVERRITRVWIRPGQAVFVLSLRDRSPERAAEAELERMVAELRATLESSADGILVTDMQGAIRGCNQAFAALWDLPQALLTERNDAAVHGWMREQVLDPARFLQQQAALERDPLLRSTDTWLLRSGRVLELQTLPQYGRGRPIGRVFSFRDVTERLANAARLELAAQVFESSLDAIFVTDASHRIVAANASCERLTGLARSALLGMSAHALLYRASERGDGDWLREAQQRLDTHGNWSGELWHRRPDGSSLPGQVALVRLPQSAQLQGATGPGGLPAAARHVGFFKDLTETVAANRRIEQLAFSDPLTGLPNRTMFGDRLEFALAMSQRHGTQFALLFLDLDRFKQINDSLGHLCGDEVLLAVADRLRSFVRQVDTAARIGGDEFVVLLNQTDARGAEAGARRVLALLNEPVLMQGMRFCITASIGVAMYPADGRTADDLLKNADTAMYRVKDRGRAGFRFYQPQMNVDLLARVKLEHAMRAALEQGRFELRYQPQVDIASGSVVGAEALLRWHDEQLGDVSPGQFIPVAEESGFIVPLGDWVLDEAVRQAAAWHAAGRALPIAVNVSALQFQQADFVERVAARLAQAKLPPALLELELTESILVQDADEALQRLQALDRLGVALAIDDFGTGYSSLGYLKRFPIKKLKIDQSFVRGLPGDASDAGIAHAVIQLGRALRLQVVAEGVETEAQRSFLEQAGCNEYQGFLFAPALSPSQFETTLVPQPAPLSRGRGRDDFGARRLPAGPTERTARTV